MRRTRRRTHRERGAEAAERAHPAGDPEHHGELSKLWGVTYETEA